MRLGILASEMEGEPTGVGRFLEGLLLGLERSDANAEVSLFFQGRPFRHPLWDGGGGRFRAIFASRPELSPVLWEQVLLSSALSSLDLFFGPAYSLPPRLGCPAMVAIHDLSFELFPEELRFRERWRRRLLARRAARRAARVLTISSHVARDLAGRYRVSPEKVAVLPLAVDWERFAPPAEDRRPSLVSGRYLLFLGSILPRRRLDLLLAAFASISRDEPDLRLVLAGPNRLPDPDELRRWIDRHELAAKVVELGWVPEQQLPPLLARADLSLYLSAYEGYGLPPLESLAAGTAPVVSSGLGFDELWPEYPFRCRSLVASEIESVVRRALESSELRRRAAEQGRRLVRTLSWEACAERFLAEARSVLEETRGGAPR